METIGDILSVEEAQVKSDQRGSKFLYCSNTQIIIERFFTDPAIAKLSILPVDLLTQLIDQ